MGAPLSARRIALCACALVAAGSACRSWQPARPALTAVVPGEIVEDIATPVRIEGRHFFNDLDASLDGGTDVDDTWTATAGGVPLTNVVRVNDTALEGVVEAGLAVGTHDVEVVSPGGRRATLTGGLVVVSRGGVEVGAVTLPGSVLPGQQWVDVAVELVSTYPHALPVVGARLDFLRLGQDVTADYAVFADTRNPPAIPAESAATFRFFVHVDPDAAGFGSVDVNARARVAVTTAGELAELEAASSWLLVDDQPPVVVLGSASAPVRSACAGEELPFAIADTSLAMTWSFDGGPSAAAGTSVTAAWTAAGAWFYAVTGSDEQARVNAVRAEAPIHVGSLPEPTSNAHLTGPIAFAAPADGQALDLALLGGGGELVAAAALLTQCDGTLVPGASSFDWVTVFVDRGTLSEPEDDRSGVDGIQRFVTAGSFPASTLGAPVPAIEGPVTLYAETVDKDGNVTGSARVPFHLTGDAVAPSVVASIPPADCGAPCLVGGEGLWFRLSEPLDAESIASGVATEWAPGAVACASTAGFVTTTADVAWDPDAWTLSVLPPETGPAATWTVRVMVDAADTAAQPNELALERCAVFTAGAHPAPDEAPAVSLDVSTISPDGDLRGDAAVLTFDAGAIVRRARLEIWRDFRRIAAVERAIGAPGTHTITWDGRDGRGAVVRDGYVEWRLVLLNGAGAASPAANGVLRVDSGISWVGPPFPVP